MVLNKVTNFSTHRILHLQHRWTPRWIFQKTDDWSSTHLQRNARKTQKHYVIWLKERPANLAHNEDQISHVLCPVLWPTVEGHYWALHAQALKGIENVHPKTMGALMASINNMNLSPPVNQYDMVDILMIFRHCIKRLVSTTCHLLIQYQGVGAVNNRSIDQKW